MNKLNCEVVKDILPLYIDELVSEETKKELEEHLEKCNSCNKYYGMINENPIVEEIKMSDEIDVAGERIVMELKLSQARLKYTFIIFAVFVAVACTVLAVPFVSTIPLIIIIPLILRLFFKETKTILFTAIIINLLFGVVTKEFAYTVVLMPLIILGTGTGIIVGKTIQMYFKGDK